MYVFNLQRSNILENVKVFWKCGLCQGDCDDDDDCADGFVCSQRDAFESVPGCFGEGLAEDREGKDICMKTAFADLFIESSGDT
jgi:hypothetical protein